MFLMFFGMFLMFLSQLGYCNFGLCFYLEINAVKKINQIFDKRFQFVFQAGKF